MCEFRLDNFFKKSSLAGSTPNFFNLTYNPDL